VTSIDLFDLTRLSVRNLKVVARIGGGLPPSRKTIHAAERA
jgi:hypothetical protein